MAKLLWSYKHSVHFWYHRTSQGSNTFTLQYFEQRLSDWKSVKLHIQRQYNIASSVLSLFWHGYGKFSSPNSRCRNNDCSGRIWWTKEPLSCRKIQVNEYLWCSNYVHWIFENFGRISSQKLRFVKFKKRNCSWIIVFITFDDKNHQ